MPVYTCKPEKLVGFLRGQAAIDGDYTGLSAMLVRELMWNAADRITELEAKVARLYEAEERDFEDHARYLAEKHDVMTAIKFVFRRRGIGLKEARDYVFRIAPHTAPATTGADQ